MANYKTHKVKHYTLDDGRIVTIKQLEDLTGIGKKTLWI